MHELTLRRPDDWHLHLRDGTMLEAVLPHTSRQFARAIVMPNVVPSVVDTALAREYRQRIESALPAGHRFTPLMTLYLTEDTDPEDVLAGHASGEITAVKLYPAGATTNSHNGVRDIEKVYPVFERMAEAGVPLCVHGEVTHDHVDIFDREAMFIDEVLEPLRQRIPTLRIIMEHLTSKEAVDYVASGPDGIAGTITAHHLILNRTHILDGGIHPHYYCMPIAKGESHRLAVRKAATSGNQRYFLGTDSAPHLTADKESASGRAGVFTAPVALSCLAHVFEQEGALDKLEAFASLYGPAFYRLPANEETIRLVRRETPIAVPETIDTAAGTVTVFDPMFPLHWDLET